MKFLNQFGSTEKNAASALPGEGSGEIGHDRMTATSLSAVSNKTGTSGTCHVSSRHRKHRSWSTTRCEDKPRKKKHNMGSGSTSLVSIPNAIKLSMLNTGLISFGKLSLKKFYRCRTRDIVLRFSPVNLNVATMEVPQFASLRIFTVVFIIS
ncbi:hypothetical protein RUM43_005095 [Polyplax serrata]|uniref:Uncharacterized protein n=1 Tax=Polyplax serrata TaxID=468196 RepID=A0AAN8XMZ3_POLSC